MTIINEMQDVGDTVYDMFGKNTALDQSGLVWDGFDFTVTLFDTGGVDTFAASDAEKQQNVDLNDGSIWDIGGLKGNVTMSWNRFIENSKGGSRKDVVRGNDFENKISGNNGRARHHSDRWIGCVR
jgi:serralysin